MKHKLSKPHSTFIPTAQKIVNKLRSSDAVTRISSGVIQSIGSGPIGIKISTESGAILLQVRCNSAVQDVRVYSTNHQETEILIEQFAATKGWPIRR